MGIKVASFASWTTARITLLLFVMWSFDYFNIYIVVGAIAMHWHVTSSNACEIIKNEVTSSWDWMRDQ